MKSFNTCILILILFFANSISNDLQCEKIVDYRMDVRLDAEKKTVTGTEVLTWKNSSIVPVTELQFHAYLNAFKNNRSTFFGESMRDMARYPRKIEGREKEDWGYLNVLTMSTIANGRFGEIDLMPSFRFIQPDDDNKDDQTVFTVTLPKPVLPDATVTLNIDFVAKLPKDVPRTGFRGDYFLVAQWFPKIGVLETGGTWNCHQFHTNSEFFADYGSYDVKITVPQSFVVGATGVMQDSTANADGTTSYRFKQDCVHDFAWTAYPHYLVMTRRFENTELPSVTMRLLLQPEHKHHAEAYFEATANTLKHYGLWYGAYPYPNITIVDPVWRSRAGGMEYPTIFSSGVDWLEAEGTLEPHSLTIHECGHQWWYGLVGTNEFEHAWLDEGFNSYSEERCAEAAYGPRNVEKVYLERNGFGFPVAFRSVEIQQRTKRLTGYRPLANADKMNKKVWEFSTGGSYHVNAYEKPALMLWTLEGYLGEEIMGNIMKAYGTRNRFKHPTPQQFIDTVNEFAPENMDWFFDQMLYGSSHLDYCVEKITSREVTPKQGFFDSKDETRYTAAQPIAERDKMYESEITVKRLGEIHIPVEIQINFEDGEEFNEKWDGITRWKKFRYTRSAPVMEASVDPERKLVLDINYTNNNMYREGSSFAAFKWTSKWLYWLQHLFEVMVFFS